MGRGSKTLLVALVNLAVIFLFTGGVSAQDCPTESNIWWKTYTCTDLPREDAQNFILSNGGC